MAKLLLLTLCIWQLLCQQPNINTIAIDGRAVSIGHGTAIAGQASVNVIPVGTNDCTPSCFNPLICMYGRCIWNYYGTAPPNINAISIAGNAYTNGNSYARGGDATQQMFLASYYANGQPANFNTIARGGNAYTSGNNNVAIGGSVTGLKIIGNSAQPMNSNTIANGGDAVASGTGSVAVGGSVIGVTSISGGQESCNPSCPPTQRCVNVQCVAV